jgi:flagellar protein FlaF
MPASNPYSQASDAYSNTAVVTDQRALEARALVKAAAKLEQLADRLAAGETLSRDEIGETLEYNQKLWTIFVSETVNDEHPLPQEIKNNLASLGMFVFKRTLDILADTKPEKIRALIEINRNLASGLFKSAGVAPGSEQPEAATPPADAKADSMA